jgi:phosphoenolpyruvate synthase/pyruvate phosphate dikinase
MVNLGNPELAFRTAMLPNDGVGLARMEFIISEHIGVHPMALANPEKVNSAKDRAAIKRLVQRYARPTDFFVEKLSEGIGTIAAAFYPKPVIVRASDFKTNEYATLLGGAAFEPKEENPMLGVRCTSPCSRRHGTDKPPHHDSVLSQDRGGAPSDRCDGGVWTQARREGAGDLCDVRNPKQCDSDRCLCRAL